MVAPKDVPKDEEKPSEVMREPQEAPSGPKEQPEPVETPRAEKALTDVYFAFDSYELSSEAMKALQDNADWITNPGSVVTVEGTGRAWDC
jgi:outer membrane protein OmpA-like peptidoglycan-associated protein